MVARSIERFHRPPSAIPGGWINAAIRRALGLMKTFDLDVKLVSYGTPSNEILAISEEVR